MEFVIQTYEQNERTSQDHASDPETDGSSVGHRTTGHTDRGQPRVSTRVTKAFDKILES